MPGRKRSAPRSARDSRQIRIIGGEWRGRRLHFPEVDGLRPSGDRLRETLFNWLQPWLVGSRCLDLFAGSGALGFEAASRGAAEVTLVERSAAAAAALRGSVATLAAGQRVKVVETSAEAFLQQPRPPYDLVFLDPPFAQTLLEAACGQLVANHLLRSPRAWVYLEMAVHVEPPAVPTAWRLHRQSRQGDVRAQLYCVEQIAAPGAIRQSPA